MDIVLITLAYS